MAKDMMGVIRGANSMAPMTTEALREDARINISYMVLMVLSTI